MESLGYLKGKEIIYIKYDLELPWFKYLPNKEWLLLAITEKEEINQFNEINRHTINNNVVYICSIGEACEIFHDVIDEDMVIRDVEGEYLPQHSIMTTWHHEFEEGIEFALFSAFGDGKEINKIVCLDITTGDVRPKLREVIKKLGKN